MYKYTLYILPVAILPQGLRLVFRTLCSELLYVQPAAMSNAWKPSVIRIGPAKNGYEYTYVGRGTYKCRCPSDWGDKHTEVLWLMKKDGVWHAFDAPKCNIPTSVADDNVIFMSAGGDAHMPGEHTWTMMKTRKKARLSFVTTLITD